MCIEVDFDLQGATEVILCRSLLVLALERAWHEQVCCSYLLKVIQVKIPTLTQAATPYGCSDRLLVVIALVEVSVLLDLLLLHYSSCSWDINHFYLPLFQGLASGGMGKFRSPSG